MIWALMMAGLAGNVFLLDKAFNIFGDSDEAKPVDVKTEPEGPDGDGSDDGDLPGDDSSDGADPDPDAPGTGDDGDTTPPVEDPFPAPEGETLDWPHPRFDGPVSTADFDKLGRGEYDYGDDGALVGDEDDELVHLSDQAHENSASDGVQVITGGEGRDLFYVDLPQDMLADLGQGQVLNFSVTDFDAENEVILFDAATPPDEIQIRPQDDGAYTEVFLQYGEDPDTAGGVSIRLEGVADLDQDALGQIEGRQSLVQEYIPQPSDYDRFNVLPVDAASRTVTEDVSALDTASTVTTSDLDQSITLAGTYGANLTTGAGDDTIEGHGAAVYIDAGAGDDQLALRTAYTGDADRAFEIYLGDGADDLTIEGAANIGDLRDGSDDQITVKVTPDTLGAGDVVRIDADVAENLGYQRNLPDTWDDDKIHIEMAEGLEGYLVKDYDTHGFSGEDFHGDEARVRIYFHSDPDGDPAPPGTSYLVAEIDLGRFEVFGHADMLTEEEEQQVYDARAAFVQSNITSNMTFVEG